MFICKGDLLIGRLLSLYLQGFKTSFFNNTFEFFKQ